MRTKFAGLFYYLLHSMYRAEGNPELEAGADKLEQVQHDVHSKAVQLGFLASPRSQFPTDIIEAIIAVIEAVVDLLNLLGIFSKAKRKG